MVRLGEKNSTNRQIRILKRTIIFIFFILILSFLGFLKERYLIRIKNGSEISIVQRYQVEKEAMTLPDEPVDIQESVQRNPKWISSLLYTFIFGFFTVLGIHLIFRNRMYSIISGAFYMFVLMLSGLIIFLSLQLNAFETGYLAGQHLKNLVQSPLVMMVLFFVFYFMERNHETETIGD